MRPKINKRPPIWLSLLYLVGLASFFFISYNYANEYAAAQTNVPSLVYEWEHLIPLLPWTILPYWSIDFFYGLSFLLVPHLLGLKRHALRLLTVQIISIGCFIAYPLRFSFERPPLEGFFGELFDILMGFDKPFNQMPSLHISLLVILYAIYISSAKGVLKWVVNIWSFLIAISVLTTWQHHFIDIPTGALLGLFCIWLWPLEGKTPLQHWRFTKDTFQWKVAAGYGTIAILALDFLYIMGWKAWMFGWIALACSLVSLGYVSIGASIFQKKDNNSYWASKLLFYPYIVAAWMNSRIWTFKSSKPIHIKENIFLGRLPMFSDIFKEGNYKWDTIIDLSAELPCKIGSSQYFNFPVLDLTLPPILVLEKATLAIEEAIQRNDTILVCCALGYSRSALVVAAWLLKSGYCSSAREAVNFIKNKKPRLALHERHILYLESYNKDKCLLTY